MWRKSKGIIPSDKVYWNGRFSNGKVWTDYAKEALESENLEFLN